MPAWAANPLALTLAFSWGQILASAATCTEVNLVGPFAPRRLMKCVNGLDIRRSTDPNSCPKGWKIWAPESRQDWETVSKSNVLPVRNPDFIVDVTRASNGCGSACGKAMHSGNPEVASWKTTNGENFWLRATPSGEPNGDYEANCYLGISSYSNLDNIHLNDKRCDYHSRDYLCQPAVKVDCTNRTDEVTGPCKSEGAVFRHSNCTRGVCESGKYLVAASGTTIEECRKLCEDGRKYKPIIPQGLTEKVYSFSQNGRFQDVSSKTPVMTRTVQKIEYKSTSGYWPGFKLRDQFYVQWTGRLRINTAGSYKFYTRSDAGSRLKINGKTVVRNGGWHGMTQKSGTIQLSAGMHPMLAEVFEGGGEAGMILYWRGPDSKGSKEVVPHSAFAGEGPAQYELAPPFKNAGPCMAFSMTADEKCLLYTECRNISAGSMCDAALEIMGDPASFKTCSYPTLQVPGTAF